MPDNGTALPTVMITVYGKPKKKKTSDALAAFPTALCIGVPSALALVAENELGFTPSIHPQPPQTLPELVQLLEYLSESDMAAQYGAVLIDDASHICQRSMLDWQENAPTGRSGRKDRFYPYQELNKHLLKLAGMSRHLGVHMVMTFHERTPGSNADGFHCPGGPDVPSRNQTQNIPSWCDVNVRAMIDSRYPDPWFPSTYFCDPTDSDWITGDRTGVCDKMTPGNLREILRASRSNYRLDRIAGLEWQDDVAEAVAQAIVGGVDPREAVTAVSRQNIFPEKTSPLHLRWACQDGIARGVLRLRSQKDLFTFSSDEIKSDVPAAGVTLPPPPPSN